MKKKNEKAGMEVSAEFADTVMAMVMTLRDFGVTPDVYAEMYKLSGMIQDKDPFGASDSKPRTRRQRQRSLPGASHKTLKLKIKLSGVSKPPIWREVEVPASFDFLQLHRVIQIVMGWTDSHMWSFGRTAYDPELSISVGDMQEGMCDEELDAAETPLTSFLSAPGDKLVYVYDFGDGWEHVVTVKEVRDEICVVPVTTAGKGEQGVEDCGGTYGLMEIRESGGAIPYDRDALNRELQREFAPHRGR